LNIKKLETQPTQLHPQYVQGDPFPHIVIDNFIDTALLDKVLEEFPSTDKLNWREYNDDKQIKLACEDEMQFSPAARELIYYLNSGIFIKYLEGLTGISGIFADPHFRGGGYHQIKKGGCLKIHTDFNWYDKLQAHRRINLLLYLNKDWDEQYGGHLELWSKNMTKCHQKILPIFNRCVIFNTTDTSYHGHPAPLTCPDDMTRKSIALYYYSTTRQKEEISDPHTTLFKNRPEEIWNNTLKDLHKSGFVTNKIKSFIKKICPPIIIDCYKYLRN